MHQVGWEDLSSRVGTVSWGAVLLASGLLLGRFVVWSWRWGLALKEVRAGVSALDTFLAVVAGAAVNLLTSTARILGGLMRARYLARWTGWSFGRATGSVIFDQVAHHVVMTAGTLIGVVSTAYFLERYAVAAVAGALLVGASLGLWVWGRKMGPARADALIELLAARSARGEGPLQRFYSHSREALDLVRELFSEPRVWRKALLLGAVFFFLNVLAQWVIFGALGGSPGILRVLSAVALGTAAGTLLGTPGGVGATEAAMIACYTALGADRLDATAATLLFRALHYLVILVTGIPGLLFLEARSRDQS
jgi:uncharacterized protein (TIRG00374 family)